MNPLDARRRLLGRNVYKKTVEGNPAIAQGSLARRYPGITMQGWTEQNGTPTPEAPVPIVSAGTQNQDAQKWEYEIEVGGANLWSLEQSIEFERSVQLSFNRELPAGEYTFSAVVHSTDTDASQCLLIILTTDGGQMAYYIGRSDGNSRVSAKISMSKPGAKISLYASTLNVASEGDTASFSDIMLNAGDTDLPYEPYRTPQTVTLTSDRPLTKWDRLEKRNGQWGWVYKSNMLSVPKAGYIALNTLAKDGKYFTAVNLVPDIKISSNPQAGSQYCNICNLGNPYEYEGNLFWIYRYTENKNGDLRIGLSDTSIDTKELFEQYISDKDIYIWYETAEETFVPLSESEQEALNTLHTYYPTTVLSNDAGCNMTLTYKTKKSLEVAT